jgi:ribosomal protein S18 acetylase RimI-like enzyme
MGEVRRCTGADLVTLREIGAEGLRHHEARFAAQERGWCDYLLAVDSDASFVGHVVVRNHSKYEPVLAHLGVVPEVNGLAAYPTGRGTGTALLDAAETVAVRRGASCIGLAVELSNHGARRLYERRGYAEWGHGEVIDDWEELANDGTVVARHRDVCAYLVLTFGQ